MAEVSLRRDRSEIAYLQGHGNRFGRHTVYPDDFAAAGESRHDPHSRLGNTEFVRDEDGESRVGGPIHGWGGEADAKEPVVQTGELRFTGPRLHVDTKRDGCGHRGSLHSSTMRKRLISNYFCPTEFALTPFK